MVGAHIWISFFARSASLGGHKLVLEARRVRLVDAGKIGLSPPPCETPRGCCACIMGCRRTAAGSLYGWERLCSIFISRECILAARHGSSARRKPYERYGDVDTSSSLRPYTVRPDGDTLYSTTAGRILAWLWPRQHPQTSGMVGGERQAAAKTIE